MRREAMAELLRQRFSGVRADALAALLRDGIEAEMQPVDPDLLLFGSKFGGLPWLPPGTPWPTGEEGPLTFVAQIDLAELAGLPAAGVLPPAGRLVFFADYPGMVGAGAADCLVRHLPPDAELRPLRPPVRMFEYERMPRPVAIEQFSLRFRPAVQLPAAHWSLWVEPLELTEAERGAFHGLLDETGAEACRQRLLGYPIPEQEDPESSAFADPHRVRAFRGHERYLGQDPRSQMVSHLDLYIRAMQMQAMLPAVRIPPQDYRLLLQVHFAPAHPLGEDARPWGLGSSLYFLIDRDSLERHAFECVVVVGQYC